MGQLLRLLLAILAVPLLLVGLAVAAVAVAIFGPIVLARKVQHVAARSRPLTWLRVKLGLGLDVDELARRLAVTPEEIRAFAPSYREVRIPKRGRGGGTRRLQVPDAATKALQRRILRTLLRRLRAHACACGFERGRSIVDNARPHVRRAVIVRMDVVDFFPSTKAARVEAYFRRIGWNREAAALLTRLTTLNGGLPQGAPTSPRLSNLVNFLLDARLAAFAKVRKGRYTRYADDITFSFPKDYPRRVRGVIQKTRRVLKSFGYALHERKKLHIRRRHQQQLVTGLVVNDKVQLSRRRRRFLRAVRHHLAAGRPATLTPGQLAGWTSFESMVRRQATPPSPPPPAGPEGPAA